MRDDAINALTAMRRIDMRKTCKIIPRNVDVDSRAVHTAHPLSRAARTLPSLRHAAGPAVLALYRDTAASHTHSEAPYLDARRRGADRCWRGSRLGEVEFRRVAIRGYILRFAPNTHIDHFWKAAPGTPGPEATRSESQRQPRVIPRPESLFVHEVHSWIPQWLRAPAPPRFGIPRRLAVSCG